MDTKWGKITHCELLQGWTVHDENGNLIPSQIVATPEAVQNLPGRELEDSLQFEIVFEAANIRPLSQVRLSLVANAAREEQLLSKPRLLIKDETFVTEHGEFNFDAQTNQLTSFTELKTGEVFNFTQQLMYYLGK